MPASLKRVKPLTSLFVLGLKRDAYFITYVAMQLQDGTLLLIFLAELLKCLIVITYAYYHLYDL